MPPLLVLPDPVLAFELVGAGFEVLELHAVTASAGNAPSVATVTATRPKRLAEIRKGRE
jgi:hypothetical protein